MNIKKIWPFLILIALGFCLMGAYSQGYRIAINSEWAKIYKWDDDSYYQSWTMMYSHGLTWNEKGEMINLWKWPSFHHCDIEQILMDSNAEEKGK